MKTATLRIKGEREPLVVTESQGKKADQLIKDDRIAGTRVVSIGDVWTGRKEDLRSVRFGGNTAFSEEEEERGYTFTDNEWRNFEIEIQKFLIKKDDEEYRAFVDRIMRAVLDSDQVIFATPFVKKRVEYLREKFSDEPSDQIDIIRDEVEKLADERMVGYLSVDSENKYLQSKGLIRIGDDGQVYVVPAVSSLFGKYSAQIAQYRYRKVGDQMREDNMITEYEKMAESLADDLSM